MHKVIRNDGGKTDDKLKLNFLKKFTTFEKKYNIYDF